MTALTYRWLEIDGDHELRMIPVPGTSGTPYLFSTGPNRPPIEIPGFFLGATPVTRALWRHVMGSGPAEPSRLRHPVDDVSFDQITRPGGFLERINGSEILPALAGGDRALRFRLPSESEWEYAARGGPHWTDGYAFSGSNDPDAVAWYGNRWSGGRLKWELLKHLKAWRLFNAQTRHAPTTTHDVATKAPNQLGIYDMSGNVWEWCQDVCVDDLGEVPRDGAPFLGPGTERRLRGGCHHNWDIHCTVSWRYGIAPDAHDGCIGFRLVLGATVGDVRSASGVGAIPPPRRGAGPPRT